MNVFKKYYQIGGITIELVSELPIAKNTFHSKFSAFETTSPLNEKMIIEHRFNWEDNSLFSSDKDPFYTNGPWKIFQKENRIIYKWMNPRPPHDNILRKAACDIEHRHIIIYNDASLKQKYLEGNLTSLSMFPTDQVLIGPYLAYKQGIILHSLGIIFNHSGLLFVGHSNAGKSTMANILKGESEILCDDRNIIRKTSNGYQLYGTWSHGDVSDISPNSSNLKAIFFLTKSTANLVEPINDIKFLIPKLLAVLIRPVSTPGWWNQSIDLIVTLAKTVPCYILKFNKDPYVIELIKELV